jgi:hypothetical protein
VLLCASACQTHGDDVIARPPVAAEPNQDASLLQDEAPLDCAYSEQLRRHKLPLGLANLYVNCEWTILDSEAPPDLTLLLGAMVPTDQTAYQRQRCDTNPQYWWQEPPPPLRPRKILFCEGEDKSCERMKWLVRCLLGDDPCNADGAQQLDDEDAGRPQCRTRWQHEPQPPH